MGSRVGYAFFVVDWGTGVRVLWVWAFKVTLNPETLQLSIVRVKA